MTRTPDEPWIPFRWQRVEALFHEALERGEPERIGPYEIVGLMQIPATPP